MSVPEAGAKYLGLGPPAAYAAVHRGEIPVIRIGKLLRVPIVAVVAFVLAALRNKGPYPILVTREQCPLCANSGQANGR